MSCFHVFVVLTLSFLTCFLVFFQQIISLEFLTALSAGKPLLSCMGLKMALQVVRPRELLVAHEPGANEGSLPVVPSQMSLEVGGFTIDFVTPGNMTVVNVFLEKMSSRRPQSLRLAAIRAIANGLSGVSSLVARQQSVGHGARHLRQAKRLRSGLRLRGEKLCGLVAGQTEGGCGGVVGVVGHLCGVHGRGGVVHVPPQPGVRLGLDVRGSGLPGGVRIDSGGVHGLHVLEMSNAGGDGGGIHSRN